MVYASHEYNNDDYIRNYDKYLVAINNENSTIPFLDLKSTYVELKDELDIAFKRSDELWLLYSWRRS